MRVTHTVAPSVVRLADLNPGDTFLTDDELVASVLDREQFAALATAADVTFASDDAVWCATWDGGTVWTGQPDDEVTPCTVDLTVTLPAGTRPPR